MVTTPIQKGGAGRLCNCANATRHCAADDRSRCSNELVRMKRRNRYYLTFHHRKKLFYAISSLILSSVLLFIGIFDIIAVTVLQNPNLSTHKFMKTVMILHAITFYLAFFGFIHSHESKSYILSKMALTAGGLLLISLVIRIAQELSLSGYYPIEYAVT